MKDIVLQMVRTKGCAPKGPDTPNWRQRTSGDEGRLFCRLCQKEDKKRKTTANGQLAHTICACVRWNISPYQQAAVVCTRHSKKSKPEDWQDCGYKQTLDKAAFAYHVHTTLALVRQFRNLIENIYDKKLQMAVVLKNVSIFLRVPSWRSRLLLCSLPFVFSCTDSL